MREYDHKRIESKWQEKWSKAGVYQTGLGKGKKCYVLDMFPYPSGSGLHVGHPKGYIATDIYARYKRANGYQVLHPMGWDSFGLPAENYAIKTKIHPSETTRDAIKYFKEQISGLSLSYDWDREIDTSSPEYYRWTQWIFLKLYENGLAYKKMAKVNWCDSCRTVLANEQVEGGICDRCKNRVIQKKLPQWFFKITDFADSLIDEMDALDWPESTKAAQKNWIGRSVGAELTFKIRTNASQIDSDKSSEDDTRISADKTNLKQEIKVFTTRPDTLFGATYMVLAPEHSLLEEMKNDIKNWSYVEKYIKKSANKTDIERVSEGKNKTGILVDGIVAVNPANGKELQIFVADYVLAEYGTGAIMAVPAHDDRDREFAEKYELEIARVIDDDGRLINSGEFDGMMDEEAKYKIVKSVQGEIRTTYRLRDWLLSRQRYWGAPIPIIYCNSCGEVPVPEGDLPVVLPGDVDFMPTGESPLARSESFHRVKCPKCGEDARRESDTMDTFVCSSWYYLRFTDPANYKEFASAENLARWMPVDMYVGGAEHTVLHLMYARFITKALEKCGLLSFGEPFIALRHPGLVIGEDGRKMSKSLGNVVNPDEIINTYGADSMRLYAMFMGPFKDSILWDSRSVVGTRRFVEKIWRMADYVSDDTNEEEERMIHTTIKKVGEDILNFKFNTAISALMIFSNFIEEKKTINKENFLMFLKIIAPFAPHMAEELWHEYSDGMIVNMEWPIYDVEKTKKDEVQIPVQIDGKVRANVSIGVDDEEDDALEKVLRIKEVSSVVGVSRIERVVYVRGRILNIVLSKK